MEKLSLLPECVKLARVELLSLLLPGVLDPAFPRAAVMAATPASEVAEFGETMLEGGLELGTGFLGDATRVEAGREDDDDAAPVEE